MEDLAKCLHRALSSSLCARGDFRSFAVLFFELRAQPDCEKIPVPKEFAPVNEGQISAEIVRIKHLDPLPKIRRKESAILKVAMEPERACIKLNVIGPNAELIRQPNVIPFFVPILRNRQRICPRGRVFHL